MYIRITNSRLQVKNLYASILYIKTEILFAVLQKLNLWHSLSWITFHAGPRPLTSPHYLVNWQTDSVIRFKLYRFVAYTNFPMPYWSHTNHLYNSKGAVINKLHFGLIRFLLLFVTNYFLVKILSSCIDITQYQDSVALSEVILALRETV